MGGKSVHALLLVYQEISVGQLKQTRPARHQEQDANLYPSPCGWVLAHFKQMVGLRF